jgi:lysophospholipase L1-like esterase
MDPEAMADVEILNLGLSGETASGLSEKTNQGPRPCALDRIDAAIAQFQPQLTFICYGMNDAIYHPLGEERFEAYREGIRTLVAKLRESGSLVVLITPPVFDAASSKMALQDADAEDFGYRIPYRGYSAVLQEYGWWILSQHDGVFATVDSYEPLNRYIMAAREADADYKFGDGVHPGDDGHLIMALGILEALDLPLPAPPEAVLQFDADENSLRVSFESTPGTMPPFVLWPAGWELSPYASAPGIVLPEAWSEIETVSVTQTGPDGQIVTNELPVIRGRIYTDLAPGLPFNQSRAAVYQTLLEMHRTLGQAGRQAVAANAEPAAAAALTEARQTAAEKRQLAAEQATPGPAELKITPARN